VKLLNLQSSTFNADQWRWPVWWRTIHVPLDTEAQPIYGESIRRLQRDLLLLLIIITVPLGTLYSLQTGYNVFVAQRGSMAAFTVNTADVLLSLICAIVFMRNGKFAAAWGSIVGLSFVSILLETAILREPGIILFALLNFTGLALFAPVRVTVALVGALLAAFFLLIHTLGLGDMQAWFSVASLFVGIMFVVICIGVVVRRVAAQSAQAMVVAQAAAVEQGRLQQRVHDLQHHAHRLASLEHDLRQPLRTVQGYLAALAAEHADTTELMLPALAAAQRTDRLLSNLLDQARAEAQQAPRMAQPTNLAHLWTNLEHTASGLARYYTDPPVPIRWLSQGSLPHVVLDGEQIERAVLNLLDNALAHSPANGVIDVRARIDEHEWWLEVQDNGPGLPTDVKFTLVLGAPAASLRLGLQQVQRTVAAHGGRVEVDTAKHGTTIRLCIPLNP